MNKLYTRLSSVLLTFGVATAVALTGSPAQADEPETVACQRSNELGRLNATGHAVPGKVVGYAKRHCNSGSLADGKIAYSRKSPQPLTSIFDPCSDVKLNPREEHEAGCVVRWLTFWHRYESAPAACLKHFNTIIGAQGLQTNLEILGNACPLPVDSGGWPIGVKVVIWLIGLGILASIVGAFFARGGGGGGNNNRPEIGITGLRDPMGRSPGEYGYRT